MSRGWRCLRNSTSGALVGLCLLVVSTVALGGAGQRHYYWGLDASYKSGDFGTGNTVDFSSFNLNLGAVSQNYEASVSLPYLLQRDDFSSEAGVGDVIARLGGALWPGSRTDAYAVNGAVSVKLPTADENRGLGTGEWDVAGLINIDRYGAVYTGSVFAGYLKVGDPAAVDYNDIWLYGVSLSRYWGRLNGYASLEGRGAILDDVESPLEINLGGFYPLSWRYFLRFNAFVGLNDGGPAQGASIGFVRWF